MQDPSNTDVTDGSSLATSAGAIESLMERIRARIAVQTFPLILPDELKSQEAAEQAKLDLGFVRPSEIAELQAYLNRRFETYRTACPAGIELTEIQLRSAYAYDCYFEHIHDWICAETLYHRSLRHRFQSSRFVPLIRPRTTNAAAEPCTGDRHLLNLCACKY